VKTRHSLRTCGRCWPGSWPFEAGDGQTALAGAHLKPFWAFDQPLIARISPLMPISEIIRLML
jgi:hypothetical protein